MSKFIWAKVPELIGQAAETIGCHPGDIRVWSWSEIFGSTAGPHRGQVGGQTLTAFQVVAFASDDSDKCIKWCDGLWKEWDGSEYAW